MSTTVQVQPFSDTCPRCGYAPIRKYTPRRKRCPACLARLTWPETGQADLIQLLWVVVLILFIFILLRQLGVRI